MEEGRCVFSMKPCYRDAEIASVRSGSTQPLVSKASGTNGDRVFDPLNYNEKRHGHAGSLFKQHSQRTNGKLCGDVSRTQVDDSKDGDSGSDRQGSEICVVRQDDAAFRQCFINQRLVASACQFGTAH